MKIQIAELLLAAARLEGIEAVLVPEYEIGRDYGVSGHPPVLVPAVQLRGVLALARIAARAGMLAGWGAWHGVSAEDVLAALKDAHAYIYHDVKPCETFIY